jgi:hypothetical protein
MAGNADQKIRPARGTPPLGYCFQWQGILPEVNSRRACGYGDVQAVVYQNMRIGRARFGNGEPREFHQWPRLEALLANLNPVGSGRGCVTDAFGKRTSPINRRGTGWKSGG